MINDNIIVTKEFNVNQIEEVNDIDLESSLDIKDASDWPVLYIMYSQDKKNIYIGETINVITRMKQHLDDIKKKKEWQHIKYFLIVYYKKSNLSIIYNLEDSMIRCALAYEKISNNKKVINIDFGHTHRYHNMSKHNSEVKVDEIWNILKEKGVVDKPFSEIEKSYMYKLSPLIELSDTQQEIKLKTLEALKKYDNVLINGIPGTGKTILALNIAQTLLERNNEKRIAIVTPVTTFATTLKKVVANVKSFKAIKIFTPIELANDYYKKQKKFDYIIVDESHRLKYCKNLGRTYKFNIDIVFWKLKKELIHYLENNNNKDNENIKELIENYQGKPEYKKIDRKDGRHIVIQTINNDEIAEYLKKNNNRELFECINQLDWIETIGKKKIYLYDELQAFRSEDLCKKDLFERLKINNENSPKILNLSEPMRIKNSQYLNFIEYLLEIRKDNDTMSGIKKSWKKFQEAEELNNNYEFKICESFADLQKIFKEEKIKGEKASCRLLSGYYTEWISNKKNNKDKNDFDFEGGIKKKWNSKKDDWCNTDEAKNLNEIGCVYTIQGYDIDYAGVIIGEELYYDNGIEVKKDNYKDSGGKKGIDSDEVLKDYIKRVYRILLTRGIKGTYLYVCDPKLRKHFQKCINSENNDNTTEEQEKKKYLKAAEDNEEYNYE